MNRKSLIGPLVTAVIVIVCTAALRAEVVKPAAAPEIVDRPQQTPARTVSPVERFLAHRVEHVQWDDISLEEVFDWFRQAETAAEPISIVPRWNQLNIEGIDRDQLVSIEMRRTTMGTLLVELMAQLSDTGSLTFHGEGNRIIISTRADFDRELELRVYDVKDVLLRIADFSESAPRIDLNASAGQGAGGRGVFATTGGQNTEELSEAGGGQAPDQILADLVELIEDTISPQTWEPQEGPGRIRGFNNHVIVVYNTIEVHEKIAGFFSRVK